MILIVDYGVGNLTSILNMFKKAGVSDVIISGNPEDISSASKILLPGVGHYSYGIEKLKSSGLLPVLNKKVLEIKTPVLGICLGAQLLTKHSEEGNAEGLGWIDGKTVKFNFENIPGKLSVPNMGWQEVKSHRKSRLLEGLPIDARFYFVHSYHMVCNDPSDVLLTANYGYDFTAAVEHENIAGVQFHPEKSHKYGMQVLYNFAKNF